MYAYTKLFLSKLKSSRRLKFQFPNFWFRERKTARTLSIFILAIGALEIIFRTREGRHKTCKDRNRVVKANSVYVTEYHFSQLGSSVASSGGPPKSSIEKYEGSKRSDAV